ncbi:MAG TPA: sel1 repeat family protein [Thermoanaerobaculia bacterium]|nr:sel1 repeat family protein [Thermoanaerobaculia bacterium]
MSARRAAARAFLVLCAIAAFAACAGESRRHDVHNVARRVLENPQWRKAMDRCPADLMPAHQDLAFLQARDCESADKWERCLERCENAGGGACYWLAYSLQESGAPDAGEVLYQQACRFGVVSGCTNRAAGRVRAAKNRFDGCSVSTFAKACELDDPWACTMYATHLTEAGGESNYTLALRALEKSCKYGADDPACSGATRLRARIETALKR